MSVIRPRPPEDPIVHEVVGPTGQPWKPGDLADSLDAIRCELVAAPEGLDLPRRLLEEYGIRRTESRLSAILAAARQIRDSVDRLVVVSGGSIGPATRLLVASCCHPFHDHLPRGERGGRSRITWLDADADNDRIQGLLDLLAPEGRPRSRDLLDQWAMLAVDSASEERAVLALCQILTSAIAEAATDSPALVALRCVTVARQRGLLSSFAEALGGSDRFHDEAAIDGVQGIFSVAGLLPASIAGIDIVRLLEGADAMLVRFAEAPVASNPVLADAACRHHAKRESGLEGSLFVGGGPALAELSAWAGHVFRFHLPLGEGQGEGAEALASLVTRIAIDEPRRDRIGIPAVALPALHAPHVMIRLPRLDEHSLGQLLQLVILSAAVEKRLRDSL